MSQHITIPIWEYFLFMYAAWFVGWLPSRLNISRIEKTWGAALAWLLVWCWALGCAGAYQ